MCRNEDMRPSVLLVMLTIFGAEANAQHFDRYHRIPGEGQRAFRYYSSYGLKVLDDAGKELRRTEPIYRWVMYSDDFGLAAVGFPLISLEQGEEVGFERGYVWVCLDYDLKPVFVFPSNTDHIYRIVNGLFFYKDKMEHSSTVGLVDKDGTVIFMAPYDRIHIENDLYVGVKNFTGNSDYSGFEMWAVEYKEVSTNHYSLYKLMTPECDSFGLTFDEDSSRDEDEETIWFEELLKKDAFQRGLNYVVHARKEEALKCFQEALNSNDPRIIECAKHNIDALVQCPLQDTAQDN